MRAFRKASIVPGARTLDARWYVSGDVFAQERERIFGHHWICAGRAEHIASSGDYVLATIAGESLIITRDPRGNIHAFYNVCRHRGTVLCEESGGTFKGAIQCPYHAWTYALDGKLSVARNMDDTPGFNRADYPLREAAVAVFEGFIFINLAGAPQPLEEAFAPLIGRFARWSPGVLCSARRITYDVRANWKLIFQNYSECYHCPVIHPQLEALSAWDSGRNDLTEGPFLGGFSTLREPAGSLTASGATTRAPLGNFSGEELTRVYYYTIFPSLLLSLHADYVMAHYVRPIAPGRSEITCEWFFDPTTASAADFDPSDAVDFWDTTNRQDWHVVELSQRGIASRAYTPGPYAQSEGLLHAFDRNYLAIME